MDTRLPLSTTSHSRFHPHPRYSHCSRTTSLWTLRERRREDQTVVEAVVQKVAEDLPSWTIVRRLLEGGDTAGAFLGLGESGEFGGFCGGKVQPSDEHRATIPRGGQGR